MGAQAQSASPRAAPPPRKSRSVAEGLGLLRAMSGHFATAQGGGDLGPLRLAARSVHGGEAWH